MSVSLLRFANGDMISAHRYSVANYVDPGPEPSSEQNQMAIDQGIPPPERVVQGGYDCRRQDDVIDEKIFRGEVHGPVLLSNSVDLVAWAARIPPNAPPWGLPGTGLWTREYVESYLRNNSIPADRPYLNCLEVTQLVRQGGAATVNTTSLSYGAMTGSYRITAGRREPH